MTDQPQQPPQGPRADRPTWLPNALVWVRLALAAAFVVMISGRPLGSELRLSAAAAVFVIAAVTDALDGMLARRWNAVSRFGRVMDPFADKILVLGAFVCLAGPAFLVATEDGDTYQASGVYPWMAVLILGRELLITSLRSLVEGQGGDFSAIWAGKWKMIVQSGAVPLVLLCLAFMPWSRGEAGRWVIDIVVWATVAVTVLSAIPYIQRAAKLGS